MKDFSSEIALLSEQVRSARQYLRIDEAQHRLEELESEAAAPDLWNDQDRARKVTTELSRVREDIEVVTGLRQRIEDVSTLAELTREVQDASQEPEIEKELAGLHEALHQLELRTLFTADHDERDAICEIHSGAGGTEACDWANMMLRMYIRWAERRGFDIEINEIQEGEEAGISSAILTVRGRYAYGLLTAEQGVHRLVRISPFDANARRHTSFAAFDCVPSVEQTEEPTIDAVDLRVDTYRSSGAGGQHVNKTDSAVRITHIPTGIVVACQNERSQFQNKARAMQILAAKLVDRLREEQKAELSALSGEKRKVEWGSQIRSYVLAPYQLVKDLRTNYETSNVDAVLDGDLDAFMEAFLQWRRSGSPALK